MTKPMITLLLLVVFLPAGERAIAQEGAPPRTVRQVSLYADVTATAVGDILNVRIIERASGSNRSNIKTERIDSWEMSASAGTGAFDFLPDFGWNPEFDRLNEGKGKQIREGRLEARMAVTVMEVRPNGDLVIAGEREVEINGEVETLTLSGVVRPADIGAGNEVLSAKIAEAKIAYKGKGPVTKGASPNIFARVLGWFF